MSSIKEEIDIKEESILDQDVVNGPTFKIENEITIKHVKVENIEESSEANDGLFCDAANGCDLSLDETERKHGSQSHGDPNVGGLIAHVSRDEKM